MERKRTSAARATCVAALALTALFLAASIDAQETRGRITGRVTDTTKAPIPGASVTLTDAARGTTASSTTGNEGLFLFNFLLPGTYQVTVEVAGFKKHIQEKVQVQISETRDLPIVLEVGGMEEAVNVTAEGAVLDTSGANMGFTVDARRIAELPLIHGDPYKIMGLATGLSHSGSQRLDRPYEPTHIVGFAFDGTRSNRSDLLIDGAPSTSTANQNEVIATYVPPSDLVQEFKVQTATFDAQFGNTEGGVTSISIKSGTNRLHGSVYYFAEPKSLAANDFFGNKRGQERPDTSSDRPGFTLSGPVRIPGLYDGRDRTFFTVGYEHIKDVRPRFDAGADSWVPTEALRNGDFSAYAGNITIYDPLTRVPSGSAFVGQPFPGNIIPANRISPVSKAILDYYSLPKNPGLNGNIYDSTLPETANYSSFTGRLDQKISNNNKAFVRYSWYNRDSIYNEYLGTPVSSGTWFQFQSYQAVVDDVHVFNPTTVLNVRYGYNRFERNSGQQEEARNFDLTTLGFPAEYNTLVPEVNRYFPRLDFDGTTMIDVAFANDFRPTTSHTVVATLNKVLAAHSLKGGMEMRIYREDSLSTANAQAGQYAFTNAYTRQTSATGTDYQGLQNYAAFLLGMPSTTSILRASDYSEYSKTWGFFAQDDWRVNEKLTLNIGLRYEVETALTERNDKSVSGFDYDYVQPIEPTVQARYAALNDPALKALVPQLSVKGGVQFAGVDGPSRLYETPKNSFLPRFGFAYQANSKTVIRGGAGLFAGFLGQRRGDVFPNGWAQTTTVGTVNNAFGAPVPRNWDTAFAHHPDPGAGRQLERPAAGPRAGDRLLQPEPGRLEAAPLSDRLPARAAGGLRGRGGVRRELRVRHRDRPQHQRPSEPVPEHGQRPDGGDGGEHRVPQRRGREPVRRAAAGDELQQPDHRPQPAAAAVPAVRRHPHHEQRRQVLVQLRPAQRAEALLQGLHPRPLLHLLQLGAGDGVPERRRRRADPDDLGPGRAAPAHRQRHLGTALREGPSVRVGRERVPERPDRGLADPGRLHLPERLPHPVRELQRHRRDHRR